MSSQNARNFITNNQQKHSIFINIVQGISSLMKTQHNFTKFSNAVKCVTCMLKANKDWYSEDTVVKIYLLPLHVFSHSHLKKGKGDEF